MLSREKCILAIRKWEKARANYNEIKSLITPSAAFNFNQKDCQWLKENNENSKFHTYIGVYEDRLILIVAPLNKNGKEKELPSYLYSELTSLTQEIVITETDTITIKKRTVLSENLEITKYSEETDYPTYNEPTITERASVKDIEKWKNECLDWFFYESNKSRGKNIFRTFSVPFSDISRKDGQANEVIAFFGFIKSSIYQTQLPILVFVAINGETKSAEIIRSQNTNGTVETNTQDMARPCPPLCKDDMDYMLLD
ncbi:hypothetical protein SAMN05661096_00088 [Marivirga sericea]|uniref:Uncharacterized protein n=1 Tax=Marivirga sericea TaxID=1028 RepID=A0A1X7I0P3_9BACT|nr:hypothetical protein [Marivirga sericea]SMG07885.1 hypothetical protein SAMN05661096_00088 [Marivirga sericea]